MKIETFEKIQQKLIDFTLLPLSLFIALSIYFWYSIWEEHLILTTFAFLAASASSLYFLTINLFQKPWSFLLQIYKDNKKYKSLRKIELDQTQQNIKLQALKPHQPEEMLESLDKQSISPQNQRKPVHLSFVLQEEEKKKEILKPLISSPSALDRLKQTKRLQKINPKQGQSSLFRTTSPTACDIMDLFTSSAQKEDFLAVEKLKKEYYEEQIQQSQQQKRFEKQSQYLRGFIQKLTGDQGIELSMRNDFDQRQYNYKKTLKQFSFDTVIMQKLVYETKLTVKQKIQENLKKQIQNLDHIQTILRKNFAVTFKSYKQKAKGITGNNIYGKNISSLAKSTSSYSPRTETIDTFGEQLKFSQVLQECVNLMHHHFFDYELIGEKEKINDVKNELKMLIKQRLQLDTYLSLKKPLCIKNHEQTRHRIEKVAREFQEQRYMNIVKLQNLAHILGEREAAQENLLKEFFSSHHNFIGYSDTRVEQINDERNIQLLMRFMVKTFQDKLSQVNNSELIKIQLSKPNFFDSSANHIWIRKQGCKKAHYDIFYSLMKQVQFQPDDKRVEVMPVYCCPGDDNIWVCIVFVRLLISKIGLKTDRFPMIKNIQTRKEFQRIMELLS